MVLRRIEKCVGANPRGVWHSLEAGRAPFRHVGLMGLVYVPLQLIEVVLKRMSF